LFPTENLAQKLLNVLSLFG